MRLLIETGLMLTSERSLDVITQCTLEAGLKLCGAQFGIFVYLDTAADGETHQLCKFSGLDAAGMRDYPAMPSNSPRSLASRPPPTISPCAPAASSA